MYYKGKHKLHYAMFQYTNKVKQVCLSKTTQHLTLKKVRGYYKSLFALSSLLSGAMLVSSSLMVVR